MSQLLDAQRKIVPSLIKFIGFYLVVHVLPRHSESPEHTMSWLVASKCMGTVMGEVCQFDVRGAKTSCPPPYVLSMLSHLTTTCQARAGVPMGR